MVMLVQVSPDRLAKRLNQPQPAQNFTQATPGIKIRFNSFKARLVSTNGKWWSTAPGVQEQALFYQLKMYLLLNIMWFSIAMWVFFLGGGGGGNKNSWLLWEVVKHTNAYHTSWVLSTHISKNMRQSPNGFIFLKGWLGEKSKSSMDLKLMPPNSWAIRFQNDSYSFKSANIRPYSMPPIFFAGASIVLGMVEGHTSSTSLADISLIELEVSKLNTTTVTVRPWK